jgi:hypothetical protein
MHEVSRKSKTKFTEIPKKSKLETFSPQTPERTRIVNRSLIFPTDGAPRSDRIESVRDHELDVGGAL